MAAYEMGVKIDFITFITFYTFNKYLTFTTCVYVHNRLIINYLCKISVKVFNKKTINYERFKPYYLRWRKN
jgi:hypothetical protein